MMDNTPRVFVGRASFWLPGPLGGRCLAALGEELRALPGVTQVIADAVTGTLSVTVDRPVDREVIAAAVSRAGIRPTLA
jgi:copper chaperone CopZ